MSVHKKKDGRWAVIYYEGGKQKWKYFDRGKDGREAAAAWDLARKRAKRYGHDPFYVDNAVVPTFAEIAAEYLINAEIEENTRYAIQNAHNNYMADLFGDTSVSLLSMKNLVDLDRVLKGKRISTRNRYKAYCKSICGWALKNGYIPKHIGNPFADFSPNIKKERAEQKERINPPTPEEVLAIRQHAHPHVLWTVECMQNLGVRPGPRELFAIKMDDIDFNKGGVYVTRTKPYRPQEFQPVTEAFLNRLRDLNVKEPKREYLIEYKSKPVRSIKTAWNATKEKAGIPENRTLRLYDLRHEYCTRLLQQGNDPAVVAKLMGHTTPTMTLGVYYHIQDEQRKSAVMSLEEPLVPDPVQNITAYLKASLPSLQANGKASQIVNDTIEELDKLSKGNDEEDELKGEA